MLWLCRQSKHSPTHTHAAKMMGVVKIRETDIFPPLSIYHPFFLSRNETRERVRQRRKKEKKEEEKKEMATSCLVN